MKSLSSASENGGDKKRTGDGILTMNYGWNQDIHLLQHCG